jgi:hypothetical protein
MTCVKYDHVFANDIEAKLPNLDTLLAATSQKKAAASLGNQPPPPPTSVARLTPDVESEDEEQAQEHEQEQEQEPEQEQSKDSKSGPTSENSEPPPPNLSPRRPRVASQEVLKRIGEGLIQDFGVEDSLDLDYVEEESQ